MNSESIKSNGRIQHNIEEQRHKYRYQVESAKCLCDECLNTCSRRLDVGKKKDKDRLKVFRMKCFRRILNIQWQRKIRNEEVVTMIGVTRDIYVAQ